MILLDTDHITVAGFPNDSRHQELVYRMQSSGEEHFGTTVINAEEQMRGWLAEINRQQSGRQQISAYDRLADLLEFLSCWDIIRFDDSAADEFERLQKQRIRIGTQDLKIASIALAQDALLLSANLRDFRRVPSLRVENWLE